MKIVGTIIPMNQLNVGRSYLLEGMVKGVDFPPGKRKSMAINLEDEFGKITYVFIIFIKVLQIVPNLAIV